MHVSIRARVHALQEVAYHRLIALGIAAFVLGTMLLGCARDETKVIQLPPDYHGPVVIVDGEQEDLAPVIVNGIAFIRIPHEWFEAWGRTGQLHFMGATDISPERRVYMLIGETQQLGTEAFPSVMVLCPASHRENSCEPLFEADGHRDASSIWRSEHFRESLRHYINGW